MVGWRPGSSSNVAVASLAVGTAIIVPAVLSAFSLQFSPSAVIYVCVLMFGSALQLACLKYRPDLRLKLVLGVSVLAHLIALVGTPAFEDDHYRFAWDGWRTLQVGTPYGVPPESFFLTGDIPPSYAIVLNGINYPQYPTIYGPFLQLVFAAGVFLTPADSLGIRILFAILNLGIVILLLRSEAPRDVALFAWNPVVVSEVALHGHPDSILALFILASLLFARRYPLLAGICLGLAACTKIIALAAWPLLLRFGWKSMAAAVLTACLLYTTFLVQGQGAGLDSTETFATGWRFNPLGFAVLEYVLSDAHARIAAAGVGIVLILGLHAASGSSTEVPMAAIFAVALLLSPAVNAWYILWVLPFAVSSQAIWPWLMALALPLSYLTGLNLDSESLAPFSVHPNAYALQAALVLAAVMIGARDALRRAPR